MIIMIINPSHLAVIRVNDAVAERLPRPYEAPPRGSRCGCRVGDSPRNYSITLPPPFPSIDGLSSLGLDCAHAEIADNDNHAHARSLIG